MNLHKFAITALLLVSLNAGAADFNYQGETLVGVGLLGTLVPVGAIIDGTVEITSPGPGGTAAPGAFGIIDVRLAVTGFDGFCFTTLPEGVGCGGTGIFVPILSVDASTVAFDDTEFPVSGSFAITAFSNTLNQALPIVFDLDAGSFISDPMDVVLGSVSGVGSFVRPATISIAPNPAVFPDTVINGNSFADITVSNSGDLDLLVQSVAGVDGLAAPFAVTADGCSGMTLVTDASCNIQLQFSPTEPGSPADSFDIVSGDLANPTVTVDVSGTVLAPDIVVAPDPVAFVTTTIGETTDVEVTITNSGTADLSVGQIANPMDAQFSLAAGTDLCSNTTVAALGQCTFTLRFEPLTEGMFMTSLVIASDDFDTPSLTLNMTGTAIVGAVAEISVDPAELSFDELLVGQSATQSIVVTNAGNADLAISSFVFSGDDAADFGQKNDCPAALGSAATCTVSVLFAPLTGGTAKSATLTINSNADMEPVLLIPLSASAFDGPRIAVDPVELDFGSPAAPIDIGASTTATATISNSGNADLTITALDFVGGDDEFSVDSETCTTAPVVAEATCTVTVVFAPLSETDKTGTLSITSNDLSNTPTSVALNGFVFRGPRIGVAELAVQINDGVTVEVGQSAADVVVLQST
ncbi:MAG: choice-of-anchor D domain-containing protein, partial [Gammaproteobacteria bacterium]|nr:choice-of-anchor D domain-containing protein [Gammaproteobacteria bacterium]